METKRKYQDLQGVRTLSVGCSKLIIEDWMIERINKLKSIKNNKEL